MYGYKCEYCDGIVRERVVKREAFNSTLYINGSPASGGRHGFWAIRYMVMRYKTSFGCPESNGMTVLDVPNAPLGWCAPLTS